MKKNYVIIAIVAAVIIILGGGIFLLSRNSSSQQTTTLPTQEPQQQILTLDPADIGLTLTRTTYTKKSPPGPALTMTIAKLNGIASIACEIHYTHTTSGGDQQEGLTCDAAITPGMEAIKQDFPFGTCSDVCHYDSNIRDVEAIIKVTKTDGKIYQVDDKLPNE